MGQSPALIAYTREGRPRRALSYARRLAELEPTNPELRQLVRGLEAEAAR